MKNISFRVSDEDYALLVGVLSCKPTQYFSQLVKLLIGSKKKVHGSEVCEVSDDETKIIKPVKTFVTETQYEELAEAAKRNGWSLSKEVRHRLDIATPTRIHTYSEQLLALQGIEKYILKFFSDNAFDIVCKVAALRSGRLTEEDKIMYLHEDLTRTRRIISRFKDQIKDLKSITERLQNGL